MTEGMDKELLKQIFRQDKLTIGKIPPHIKKEFTGYAKEYFCDDYGSCLQAVWTYFKQDMKFVDLLSRLASLEERVSAMESKPVDVKTIKTLSGDAIERGEKNG